MLPKTEMDALKMNMRIAMHNNWRKRRMDVAVDMAMARAMAVDMAMAMTKC